MRVDQLTGSNTTIGGFFTGINNTGNSATTNNPTVIGARLQCRVDPADASKYNLGIFNHRGADAASATWSPALNVGDYQSHAARCSPEVRALVIESESRAVERFGYGQRG